MREKQQNRFDLEQLLGEIRACTVCKEMLTHGVNPVMTAAATSKIIIIGQAPGRKVHESGIPWNDQSGANLRDWLGLDSETFYDTSKISILPMGFCYPGTTKKGDLPPRKECAPLWHEKVLDSIPEKQLVLLIGQYAQKYYLGKSVKKNLTETVKAFEDYLPQYFVLPHPSPRNFIWKAKNKWFESEVLPILKVIVKNQLEEKA